MKAVFPYTAFIFKHMSIDKHSNLSRLLEFLLPSCTSPASHLEEEIKLDISLGDVVLGGKWKNKRMVVKSIGKDELGQPTINGKNLLTMRIEKELPKDKQSKETREKEEGNSPK